METIVQQFRQRYRTADIIMFLMRIPRFPPAGEECDSGDESVVATCANCHNVGHTVADCVWADPMSGDILGCPVCNARHDIERCLPLRNLTLAEKYQLFVLNRGSMAPLKRPGAIGWVGILEAYRREMGEAFQPPQFLPWSYPFARQWARTVDSDVQTTVRQYYATGNRGLLPVDPSTASLEVLDQLLNLTA